MGSSALDVTILHRLAPSFDQRGHGYRQWVHRSSLAFCDGRRPDHPWRRRPMSSLFALVVNERPRSPLLFQLRASIRERTPVSSQRGVARRIGAWCLVGVRRICRGSIDGDVDDALKRALLMLPVSFLAGKLRNAVLAL